jgi:hypothetical protein
VQNASDKEGNCGAINMEVVDANKNPLTGSPPVSLVAADGTTTLMDWQINMGTSDPALYTNAQVTYYLKVYLAAYESDYPETTLYEAFTVEIKNCMITDLVYANIVPQTYNIYTTGGEISIPQFTQVVQAGFTRDGETACSHDVTYSLALADGSALPSFMHWNFIDRLFTYYTDKTSDVKAYNVVMTATVSADQQSGGFTKEMPFTITVADGCSADSIYFTGYTPDHNYYLGVVTDEANSWTFATGKALATWDVKVTHTEIGCPVTFRLERLVGTDNRRPFTPEEDAVFSEIDVVEDNDEYTLLFDAITDNLALENESWRIAIVAERGVGNGQNDAVV